MAMVSQRYGTVGQRLGAAILDIVVHMCLVLSVAVFVGPDHFIGAFFWGGVLFLSYPVYSVWMHTQFGQTLGKMVFEVVVLDISEQHLSKFRQAFLRDSVCIFISVLLLFLYWGYLFTHGFEYSTDQLSGKYSIIAYVSCGWAILELATMLFHPKRRALHDLMGSTVVLKGNRKGWLKKKRIIPSDSGSFQPVNG